MKRGYIPHSLGLDLRDILFAVSLDELAIVTAIVIGCIIAVLWWAAVLACAGFIAVTLIAGLF